MLFHHRQKSELHRYGEMFKDPMDKIINFEYLMKFVKQALSYSDDKIDKLDTLNYIIDTVKIDLQTSLLANIFYDNGTPSDTTAPFPGEYCDENGVIMADVFHAERLFKHVYTDGAYWYNSHTKQTFKEVYDFRTAAIYEMCKIRLKLETE